MIKKDGRYM